MVLINHNYIDIKILLLTHSVTSNISLKLHFLYKKKLGVFILLGSFFHINALLEVLHFSTKAKLVFK